MAGNIVGEIFYMLGFKVNSKDLDKADNGLKSLTSNIRRTMTVITGTMVAWDRMTNAVARSNQMMISFNRQTGIALETAQRLAGAASLSNYNLDENTALAGMQAIQSNLAQIRIGQGDISPYQILGINPVGKDAKQVLEDLRGALRGVDDAMATNLIQQMGLSPEMITLLRASNKEFEQMQAFKSKYSLNEQQREQANALSLELKKTQMQIHYFIDNAMFQLMPTFVTIMRGFAGFLQAITPLVNGLAFLVKWIVKLRLFVVALIPAWSGLTKLAQTFGLNLKAISFKGILTGLKAISAAALKTYLPFYMLYLILEDLYYYFTGGGSVFGDMLDAVKNTGNNPEEIGGIAKAAGLNKYGDWLQDGGIAGKINKALGIKDNGAYSGPFMGRTYQIPTSKNNEVNQNVNISFDGYQPEQVQGGIDRSLRTAYIQLQGATA